MSEIKTRLINFTRSSLNDDCSGMNFFEECVLPPQNTPESDPFITALTGDMDAMQDPSGGPPPFDNWPGGPPPPGGGLIDDPGFTGSDRAFMWQQNHYMPDTRVTESGFISGSTTQPPSMTGHDEDMEGNYVGGPGSITGSSIYNLDALPQSETSSIHSAHGLSVDPDVFIPKLIEGLEDTDQLVSDEVLCSMDKFSRKERFLQAIMQSDHLIRSLVKVLESASTSLCVADETDINPEEFEKAQARAKSASNIMQNMSNSIEGKKVIVNSGGIAYLTSFLLCPVDRVMFIAISTLHNLLLVQDEKNQEEQAILDRAKEAIRAAGGSQAMAALLNRDKEDKLRTIVIDCLRILSMKHAPTKQIILQQKGPHLLVEIMRTRTYKNLLLYTSRLLKDNKPAIIKAGGIDAIAKGLTHESNQIKVHCIWTLRNLSDAANSNINDLSTLVQTLVELLSHPDKHISICSAGILFNLTCNNNPNKIAVCKAGGILHLVNTIRDRGSNKELLEPAVCALKHITNGHEQAGHAQQHLLQNCMGLPVLLEQLRIHMHNGPHWPSVKAILGLLRNLAQKTPNQSMLREHQGVTTIKDLFCFVVENYMMNLQSPPVENVRPEEIVELSLGCVFFMAKDQTNRNLLRDCRLLNVLGQLASGKHEKLQRLAIGSLHELSFDPASATIMCQDPSLHEPIRELVTSGDQKISEFAHGVMQNLQKLQRERPDPMQMMMPSPMMQNQHVTDVIGCPPGQFPPPPHLQQHQQQQQQILQQRRFQGQQQQQMQGQNAGYDMMAHNQHGYGGGQRTQGVPFGGGPSMDQSADFLDMGELMSPVPDGIFYDDSMTS